MIDTPRVRKQTRQYSTLRGEGGDLSDMDSDDDYPPHNSRQSRASRRSDRHSGGGYGRTDCFRVEKHLLVYGFVNLLSYVVVPKKPVLVHLFMFETSWNYDFIHFNMTFSLQMGPLAGYPVSCSL